MTALRKALPRVGQTAKRWGAWQASQRRVVSLRAMGRCELCGVQAGLEVHHTAGRRNNVGEPFASWAPLCAALCRPCHRAAHLEGEADKGRWQAVDRLQRWAPTANDGNGDPLDEIRGQVRRLEELGFDPQEAR